MAQKLSVQIALEGGAELKRQFAELGQEGTKAFTDIKKAAASVGGFQNIDPTKITKVLQDVGITGVATINKIQDAVSQAGRLEGLVQGVRQLEDGFSALGKVIGPLGGQLRQLQQAASATYRALGPVGVAGGAAFLTIGAAIGLTVKATIGLAEAINKTSTEAIKLGLSFGKLDQLQIRMEQAGMAAPAISSGIATLKENLDKLEVTRLQKVVEGLKEIQTLGARFAPGQGPAALKELQAAATKIGVAGDFAREALRKLNIEMQQTSNVRFLPGVVPTLEQLKDNIDPVVAGLRQLGIVVGQPIGEQYTQITEKLRAMTDVAERNRLALLLLGEAAGTAFIQSLPSSNAAEQAANRLLEALNRLKAAWDRFGSVTLAPTLTTGIDSVTAAIEALQALINKGVSWQTLSDGAVAAFNLITNAISAFTLQGMLSWIARAAAAWSGLFDLIQSGLSRMQGMQAPDAPLPESGGIPMASGGLLGGRGTGTSDSNLAWLSRGEYVIPAHAVRQPGVLALLEGLRRSGGNLRGVLDDMGRFARGGLMLPAFAAGGINRGGGSSASRVLNLTIEGRSFGGLSVPEATAQSLERFAVHSQIASTGRKPSWRR